MTAVLRAYLRLVIWLNRKAKSAAVRLTRLTGKSPVAIHPKHLLPDSSSQHWYLDYVGPGQAVLDIGCGNGAHSVRVASQGASVLGVDCDRAQLRTAALLASQRQSGQARFVRGSAEDALPIASGAFDLALLLDVIEHLHRRAELLREIRRVLRPSGRLLISLPNHDTSWKRRLRRAGLSSYTDPDHKVEYAWADAVAELRQGGFVPDSPPEPIVYDTPWAGIFDLTGGFSMTIYGRLARWKQRLAQRKPEETIGWRVVCRPTD
jgi:2-polyprenyl-3-methyl-5-hydroxy-6-metoxy-1,4-benzoquinol methylase